MIRIPDSKAQDSGLYKKNFPYSGFQKQKFSDSESGFQESPIGFFKPVIPIQSFVQSRNPDGYFASHLLSSYFQSQNSPYLCCKIPNPQFQIKGNLGSRKYHRFSLIPLHESYITRNAVNSTFTSLLNKLFSKYFPEIFSLFSLYQLLYLFMRKKNYFSSTLVNFLPLLTP